MKNAIIVSIRSSHMDSFPAWLVMESIKYLNAEFSKIPVTLCYEEDPTSDLNTLIDVIKKKISNGRSRYLNQPYTLEEEEHDKANFRLLQAARLYKSNFVLTDLSGIDKIPLGDPRVQQLKPNREKNMAEIVATTATEFGGIVFDFGGIDHTSSIQTLLKESTLFKDNQHQAYFFCVYSKEGQQYLPSEFRSLQFMSDPKIPTKTFPFGIEFLTTALSNSKETVLQTFTKQLKCFAEAYLKNTEKSENNSNISPILDTGYQNMKNSKQETNQETKQNPINLTKQN